MTDHHGATPTQWAHFSKHLGLTTDLLPVVSDPGAKISAKSKMQALGKTPSLFNRGGLAVGIPGWTQRETTDAQVRHWSSDDRLGICIQTRFVRALDIDIESVEHAHAVRDAILACPEFEGAAVRFRPETGKCLVAFVLRGDHAKRILHTAHGNVEFLADGQQFVAIGRHPRGVHYGWCIPSTGELALPARLPELTPEQFESVWSALVAAFGVEGGDRRERLGLVPVAPRRAADASGDHLVEFLRENGHVREFSHDGRVDILCPWHGEHTSDSGPSSTSYFPAGVGGFQQGHFRCLHAHCAGRTDGDFLEAIGYVLADFEVIEAPTDAEGLPTEIPRPAGLTVTRTGRLEATANNINLCLCNPAWGGIDIGFDDFTSKRIYRLQPVRGRPFGEWQPFTDASYTDIKLHLIRVLGMAEPSSEAVKEGVRYAESNNTFDSARQWLESLRWDGVDRLDFFACRYLGAEDTDYSRAVGRYMLTALAGRIMRPGCQADMVPVLVGAQGIGKSRALQALAPTREAFTEMAFDPRNPDDQSRRFMGRLMIEMAELKGMRGRDSEAIKEWITRTVEEWTPKYVETPRAFRRRAIMVGTSNDPHFLGGDASGYRRWLPLDVERCDVAAIREDMEQLWAEALVAWVAGGIEWQDAQDLAAGVHDEHTTQDPRESIVMHWLHEAEEFEQGRPVRRMDRALRMQDVLRGALGVPFERQTVALGHTIGLVLRKAGMVAHRRRVDGVRSIWWVKDG